MIKENERLFKTNKTEQEISNLTLQINYHYHDCIGLVCRGDRMKTWQGFANELSAVLQFPYYFSNNGNSLSECICDLDWICKRKIFVFITNAEQILIEESYGFLHYFERSVEEVPIDSLKYYNEEKHVYYIFQNIDQDFPLFEDKELSDFI
ncbi:barstar family protein [Commensalibacter nepenthis]|uniref:Barstar family protein n=1 Tax=Commensalibacter nepenthis TaxID=3043872 RepID=A0ABT6Q486_9PROT|nr:barstar family protein [Commensalibacter sp. TBRC 10068]MDI2111707.1 barstar family protein [Commensalibacter sp. TBRC 10068]